ncbi:MAG: ATP-binding cassette domain-containing protein [Acidilobaceae archaeon]|nr:ATP-binding cassette domain-containing protein [Acidilobaceae archaeon]MCX8165269.1 ATP-binding cassette domain-containing protein [Acidilobaceae archaeon]MDW7973695.1 ATP-binding cassette domain-containing protein [Sulfolobales archaeon]
MLSAKGLRVYLKGIEVLRGVSLQVMKGEVVCLLGRNGAGKTTTLKTVVGFYSPQEGRVELEGRDITFLPVHERARLGIGYTPEDLRVYPWLSARENILLAAKVAGRDEKEAMEIALSTFPELEKLLDRKGFYLSGGEKRMVAVARALVQRPKYLLLDELLEGLAPVVAQRLSTVVRRVAKEGVGVLAAESNAVLAKALADRVYVIERGEVIYEGSVEGALSREDVARAIGISA